MNGKRAKAIRRLNRANTVGLQDRHYELAEDRRPGQRSIPPRTLKLSQATTRKLGKEAKAECAGLTIAQIDALARRALPLCGQPGDIEEWAGMVMDDGC